MSYDSIRYCQELCQSGRFRKSLFKVCITAHARPRVIGGVGMRQKWLITSPRIRFVNILNIPIYVVRSLLRVTKEMFIIDAEKLHISLVNTQ